MLIDTHAHLDFDQFDADRDQVIKRAHDSGVLFIINVGIDLASSLKSVEFSDKYAGVFASVGIHPHYALKAAAQDFDEIKRLFEHKKTIAVGEIGLDYFNHNDPQADISCDLKKEQQKLLCHFLECAGKIKKPVILHCRRASWDLEAILRENLDVLTMRGVIHCFSEGKEFLRSCLDFGFNVSFTAAKGMPSIFFIRSNLISWICSSSAI